MADKEKQDEVSEKGTGDQRRLEEHITQTQHAVVIDGQEHRYTATAGTILLKEENVLLVLDVGRRPNS